MKRLLFCFLLSISCHLLTAQETIKGVWHTGQDNATVEFYKNGARLFGKLLTTDNRYAKIGMIILHDLSFSKDQWKGKIYAPRRDKLYSVSITPGDDTMELLVTAGIFKKKLTWKKVE